MRGELDLERFPSNETAQRMMEYVTGNGFYDRSYVGKWLFQVMGTEMEDARRLLVRELPLQIFPETATWGLVYHEQKYHLPGAGNLEERRRQVIKKETEVMPFIPDTVRRSLSNLYGIDLDCIEVEEDAEPFTFRILYQERDDTNIPAADSRKYMMSLKPSHLHLDMLKRYSGGSWLLADICSVIRVRSVFYPGLSGWEPLFLDGSWKLDGSYLMDGIQAGRVIEFYPLRLGVFAEFFVEAGGLYGLKARAEAFSHVFFNITGKLYSDIYASCAGKNSAGCIGECEINVDMESRLICENNVWRLDGTFPLDGGKRLDARIKEFEL